MGGGIIGRDQEKKTLDSLLESNERICLTICGDVGVGKTSLINFQKFVWKYSKQKLLFSFRREIEASFDLLNKKNFLIEIIGSVLREIKLLHPELLKDSLLEKLSQIVDISQTLAISGGGSAFGFGLEASGERKQVTPIQLSITILEQYFLNLIKFVKDNEIKGLSYSGLVVHVNNFDVVMKGEEGKQKVIAFFEEIRDILQTPDVYFIFLGPKLFFKEIISPSQRVKSIFYQTPLILSPLSKTDITKAFKERMELLKSDDVSDYIKPVEDEVVYRIYDLYNGDVRSIMSSIVDIMGQNSEMLSKPLTIDEAMLLLGKERWEKIEMIIRLTTEQKEVLKYLASRVGYISQKEIVSKFNKAQSNVSGYYFKPLRDHSIIEEKERKNQTPYYGLTLEYEPLKWLVQSQDKVKENLEKKSGQLSFLFKK